MAFKPTVGLDIGTQQIKAVELRPSKSGRLAVAAIGVAPTPAGVLQNNIITDPQLMGQAIKQLLRESGITAKRVVGSVAGQSAVVVRIIEVPKMTDAELKETMRWEVERHVPFAPSETVIDYQPLANSDPMADANPNMEVLLAVAQQDVIANYVDTVFAAGLDPAAIDIEPLAVARAALDLVDGRPVVRAAAPPPVADPGEFGAMPLDPGAHETVAIVNIGATNTDINIYQDGQLAFPRSLPLAGDSLTRAIADALGYPLEQAERFKREYAAVQLDRMAVYTGTYYGDAPGFDAPQFGDDGLSFSSGEPSSRRRGAFGEGDANPFEVGAEGPQFDDLNRTQPMSSRLLDLAQRQPPGESLSSAPPADSAFAMPGAGAGRGRGAAQPHLRGHRARPRGTGDRTAPLPGLLPEPRAGALRGPRPAHRRQRLPGQPRPVLAARAAGARPGRGPDDGSGRDLQALRRAVSAIDRPRLRHRPGPGRPRCRL